MTVRVGEMTSEVQVTGRDVPAPEAGGQGQAGRIQPGWQDHERHAALERARCRDAGRTASRRFHD